MKPKFKNWILSAVMLLSIITITNPIVAQPETAPNTTTKNDRVEALRVAYITNRLNLTPDEAQRFWPVFNQYKSDMKTLRQNFHPKGQEVQLTADEQLEFEQKKLDLKKRYKPQFETCIGKDKVNRLATAEEDFKAELMRIMRERREARGQRPGR